MYLKSIRSQGFKSFADKIDLEINPGITGIVGPNGSGKSNIVDAVRWVLGEQSVKSLRSSSMSDVIFNGSASREAQKRAMVALTFDNRDHYLNSDFAEVEVKRVVYRTGENEYYLNNTRVRLKDITDLFIESGTGMGAFNIISQGNVTDIVNGKSTDRRVIIESAARVLKYKKRKEESLHKLAKTEENLLRINLIIQELKTTVEPLAIESAKAQKYTAIKDDLESLDIALMCEDIAALNETYQTTKGEIDLLKSQTENYTKSLTESKLEKLKLTSLSVEDKINTLREKLLDLTKKLSNLDNEKRLTIERQKYMVDSPKIDESLVALKEAQLNLVKNIAVIEQEMVSLKEERTQKHAKYEEITNNLFKLKVERDKYQSTLANKNKESLMLQNKIEILTNNINNESSSPLAVRNVLANPRLKGIHEPVGNLVKTTDQYLVALDTALGNSKNYIVVTDEDAAIGAINYLKENRLGRATFLPLNIIGPRNIPKDILQKVQNIAGYIGPLNELVTCDEAYQNIIDNQLGNVIVTKDALAMKAIGKLLNHKYRLVSLEGEMQNVGGSLTGGISKTNNIIYEKAELNKLKESFRLIQTEIVELNDKLEAVTSKITAAEAESSTLIKEDLTLKENLAIKEETLKEYTKTKEEKESELAGLESWQNNELDKKLDTLLAEINLVTQEETLTEKEMQKLMQEKNDLGDEINILEKQVKEANALINSKLNDLKTKEVLLGKTEVKLDNLLKDLNEEYNLTYDYAAANYTLTMDANMAREKVNTLKKELQKIGEVNLGSIAEYERLNTRYEFLQHQKDDLEKASSELKQIITEMDEIMIQKFAKTFAQVEKEFSRIFTLMFKGGQGKLVLTDANDLLNTGIDIIAIPPGKKIASPLALSGGEKALTAICLLFAILEINPAPFIILDEAEAALDEANVDMFGKYLNKEKSKSQFIVITHKKRMMEYADTLYGMTMQESGVSKIVSTKLEN